MTYIHNTLGVIGCVIFLWLILGYIHKGETWQKIGLLVVLGLTLGSQIFMLASLAFYFCMYHNPHLTDKISRNIEDALVYCVQTYRDL